MVVVVTLNSRTEQREHEEVGSSVERKEVLEKICLIISPASVEYL